MIMLVHDNKEKLNAKKSNLVGLLNILNESVFNCLA